MRFHWCQYSQTMAAMASPWGWLPCDFQRERFVPTPSTLPVLSDDELSALFGDDLDALRRYRLLHAILVTGMTQREAATAYAVSERTVRNVLRAYARGGLDALRSRTTTSRRRRDRRSSQTEQALVAALAEEPLAGGDRLWRRAQELLGESGEQLSRRTTYRLLAHLRSERDEDDPPDSMRSAVRTALPLLPEDPPLALGGSPLAQRLLSSEVDPLQRGLLLQQAIRAALDHLRPAGTISTIDRSWWPYLICTGEYEASQRRAELQNDLALSASTYSRAKRQGIDRITSLLPQIVSRMVEAPTRLASQRLPRTPDFVGRREEQSYYAWRLQTEGLAHIWGLPGSGKTALAAELAAEGQRYGQTILWHTCRAGRDSTLPGIIRGLAQALAGTGDETLWREVRQAPGDTQNSSALLDILRERLRARPAVIVLDDFHRVDPQEAEEFLETLDDLVERHLTRMLLVGRNRLAAVEYPALPAMSEREAQLLWSGLPALSPEQWTALYTTSGGLPEPLRRAVAAYRRAGDLARPVDWMDAVAEWANEEIWSRLDDDEQRLLAAAHMLAAQRWVEQADLVGERLGVGPETFERLRQRDLLGSSSANLPPFTALRPHIAARLREDTDLREELQALSTSLDVETAALDTPTESDILGATEQELGSAAVPAGLELLSRLRDALEVSASYLQEHPDDRVARRLAVELEALQAALPDPMGPRPFLAQPATGVPAR